MTNFFSIKATSKTNNIVVNDLENRFRIFSMELDTEINLVIIPDIRYATLIVTNIFSDTVIKKSI